jgi:hypothetical protein
MSVLTRARRRRTWKSARRARRFAVLTATDTIAQQELLASKLYRYDA